MFHKGKEKRSEMLCSILVSRVIQVDESQESLNPLRGFNVQQPTIIDETSPIGFVVNFIKYFTPYQ